MITKHFLSVLLLLLLCCSTFVGKAQDTSSPATYNNEWGVNITGFANQFLSFNGNTASSGPYLITYKRINKGKAFRLGFGANANYTDGESLNSPIPFTQNQYGFDVRIGTEKQHEIYKRWLFTTGFDGLLGASYSKFSSDNNFNSGEQKSTVLQLGLGPVLGIHYRINNRVSIGTESSIYLTHTYSKDNFSNGFNNSNSSNSSNTVRLIIAPPLALYFSLRI